MGVIVGCSLFILGIPCYVGSSGTFFILWSAYFVSLLCVDAISRLGFGDVLCVPHRTRCFRFMTLKHLLARAWQRVSKFFADVSAVLRMRHVQVRQTCWILRALRLIPFSWASQFLLPAEELIILSEALWLVEPLSQFLYLNLIVSVPYALLKVIFWRGIVLNVSCVS